MKTRLILTCAALTLWLGCARQEQATLRSVLIERFQANEDIKAYHLDPAAMADCVIDEIAASLPGFAGDPRRPRFYTAYTRFLTVQTTAEAEAALAEYGPLFASPQEARMAATRITEHEFTCMGKLIEDNDHIGGGLN
jgi:hypothetical protein